MRFSIPAALATSLALVGFATAVPSLTSVPAGTLFQPSLNGTAVASQRKGPSPDLVLPDYDAVIYCSSLDCTGTCYYVDIDAGVDEGVCYLSEIYYESIVAYSPSGGSWDLLVYAGYADCDASAELANLNVCYNLEYNGAYAEYNSFYFEA